MSTKTVYFYKLTLFETETSHEVSINQLKVLMESIIRANSKNSSISLASVTGEQIFMDVLEEREDYLFLRLSKKKYNHSIQKRNYATREIAPVITPLEAASNGIEVFTYCIIGYSHGIVSIARNQGTPDEKFIQRLFTMYKPEYYLKIDSVPNSQLVDELYNSDESEVNRITVEIPTPSAEMLSKVLNASDEELLDAVQDSTQSVVIEVKPQKRGHILNDEPKIKILIDALKNSKRAFKKVVLEGKTNANTRQRSYDLYEEYFKYQININETHIENGRKVEYSKDKIQRDYRSEMMNIYDGYRKYILAVCDRL